MRTSFPNWSRENILGLIVSSAVIVLPTLSCGVALCLQPGELQTRRQQIVQKCRSEADAVAPNGDAGQAFAACIDSGAYAVIPSGITVGMAELTPGIGTSNELSVIDTNV